MLFVFSERSGQWADQFGLPEDDHFLRHDPWAREHTVLMIDEQLEREHQAIIQLYSSSYPILRELQMFQVYRMGDDGNEMPVDYPTSEIDARCHVAELESHKHKQIYWYRRCIK